MSKTTARASARTKTVSDVAKGFEAAGIRIQELEDQIALAREKVKETLDALEEEEQACRDEIRAQLNTFKEFGFTVDMLAKYCGLSNNQVRRYLRSPKRQDHSESDPEQGGIPGCSV